MIIPRNAVKVANSLTTIQQITIPVILQLLSLYVSECEYNVPNSKPVTLRCYWYYASLVSRSERNPSREKLLHKVTDKQHYRKNDIQTWL